MKPRERVLKALRHEEPDRVPTMYRDVPEVRSRLLRDLRLRDEDELLDLLGVDFRWIQPKYVGPALEIPESGHRRDIWGVEWKYTRFSETAGYWNEVSHPLAEITDPRALEHYPWPDPKWWDFSILREEVEKYDDYALMTYPNYCSPGILQSPIQPLVGIERSLTDFFVNPEFYRALIQKILDFQIPFIDRMLEAAGNRIDFFRIGDDFGTQRGLLISSELWCEYFQAPFREMAETAKRHDAYYYQHSCGAVGELIPHLLEIGLDVLDPLQIRAAGMDPQALKIQYGGRLCFSGGVDEQELLPKGSPGDVKDGVRKLLDIMAPGGGFFVGPTHNFQDDIPTENIIAMYEAARDWKY